MELHWHLVSVFNWLEPTGWVFTSTHPNILQCEKELIMPWERMILQTWKGTFLQPTQIKSYLKLLISIISLGEGDIPQLSYYDLGMKKYFFFDHTCIIQTEWHMKVRRSMYILGFLLEGSHWIPRFWARLCDNTCATAIGRPYCFSELKVCGKHLREGTKLVIIS